MPPVLAQPGQRTARVAVLVTASEAGYARQLAALRAGLREHGYDEGRNLVLDVRAADGEASRIAPLADALVAARPDVLVSSGQGVAAVKRATSTLPIVMAVSADAERSGLVASLARPGGNVTGSSFFLADLNAKRIDVLLEVIPSLRHVLALLHQGNRTNDAVLAGMRAGGGSRGLAIQSLEVVGREGAVDALRRLRGQPRTGVVVSDHPAFVAEADKLAGLARDARVPTIGFAEWGAAGGLVGYGVNFAALWHRAADYVDRILKGAKPADLPVEQPGRFELVVNLATAAALGIAVPQALLLRADAVVRS